MTATPGERTRTPALALAIALDRARNLARGADLAHGADLAREDALAIALDHAFALAFARAGESADALALARALAFARVRVRDVGSSPDLARELDIAFDLARELDVGYDLTSDLVLASGLDLARARDLDAGRAWGPGAPRVVPTAGRLVLAATRLLPVQERSRYTEEFESELWEIAQAGGGRRAQLAYAARQVMAARRLRAGLRVMRRRGAVP
jgi:hypothetical protein